MFMNSPAPGAYSVIQGAEGSESKSWFPLRNMSGCGKVDTQLISSSNATEIF